MSFDWKEYLNLGLVLHGLQPKNFKQEAALRSSVSRIYYSCYHLALEYVISNYGYIPVTRHPGENHWRVRDELRRNRKRFITRKLSDLHQKRKQCDYDDVVVNLPLIVNSSINDAREIMKGL